MNEIATNRGTVEERKSIRARCPSYMWEIGNGGQKIFIALLIQSLDPTNGVGNRDSAIAPTEGWPRFFIARDQSCLWLEAGTAPLRELGEARYSNVTGNEYA